MTNNKQIEIWERVQSGDPLKSVPEKTSSVLHYKKKYSRHHQDRSDIHFAQYFDFEETKESPKPTIGPLSRIGQLCQQWVDGGKQIARDGTTFKTVECVRNERGFLRGVYRTEGEFGCPIGLTLEGTESHFMYVLDFANTLGVDEFWAIGFMHGFDNSNYTLIGKHLEKFMKNGNYVEGRQAGNEIADKFIR